MTAFSEAFVRELPKKKGDALDIICVDGKVMRGTLQSNGRNPDIVSAYSPRAGITLATEACDEKSNEIKEVPRLIERLTLLAKW